MSSQKYTIEDYLNEFPHQMSAVTRLGYLAVPGTTLETRLTSLEGVEKLTTLKKLILFRNHIDSSIGVEFLTRLQELDLSENRIASLRCEFPASLRELKLERNRITSLEGALFPPGLKKLILSHNQIANLFGDVLPPPRQRLPLKVVSGPPGRNDRNTAIAHVLHSFSSDKKAAAVAELRGEREESEAAAREEAVLIRPKLPPELTRKIMHAIEIPSVSRLVSLEELDLSHNRLTCLEGIEFLSRLENLHLEDNQLTSLAGLTLPLSLKVLNTTGNPIVDLDGLEIPFGNLTWVGVDDVSYLWTQGSHILNQPSPLVVVFERVGAPSPPPPHEHNSDNEEEWGGKRKKQHKQMTQGKKNKKKYRRKTKKNGIKNERRRNKVKS